MWSENLPAVAIARRFRELPLLQFATVDQLFRLADAGRQIRYEAGRVLFEEDGPPTEVLFLLEGEVALSRREGEPRELAPPALLALNELLEATPLKNTVAAPRGAIALSIPAEEFLTLLSENVDLARGLFRLLLDEGRHQNLPVIFREAVSLQRVEPNGELSAVQKSLLVQDFPLFRRATAEDLLALAATTRKTALVAGRPLFEEADPPAMHFILSGSVNLVNPATGTRLQAGPGDVTGARELLAGIRAGWRAEVAEEGEALRLENEDFLSLLADHPELLHVLFAALFRSVDNKEGPLK